MTLPDMSSQVAVGALTFWMIILAIKHVMADFVLQTSWMATGKDAKKGWALPLLVHCAIHGVLAIAILLVLAPRLWFLGLVDFVLHLIIDRAKGFCVATFNVTQESHWFWWLIGIDQALHHLTNFALAVLLAAN
jgi:Protein of unknown function (DUF3307)